MEKQQFPQKTD